MTIGTDERIEVVAKVLAEFRHRNLGVTYGRKKVSVMAIDLMEADAVLDALRTRTASSREA